MEIVSPTTMEGSRPKSVDAVCSDCGKSFEKFPLPGILSKFQTKCGECFEREYAQETAGLVEDGLKLRKEQYRSIFAELCPPLYRATDRARIPQDKLSKVMSWKYGPRGLVLHGESGKHKTRCMWLLVERLLSEGKTVRIFDCIDFELDCSDRFLRGEGKLWLRQLLGYDVVIFDDLGKFKLTDRVESALFGFIEKQIANLRPIIATTNDTGESLEGRMTENRGAPLVRRLKEFCECVAF